MVSSRYTHSSVFKTINVCHDTDEMTTPQTCHRSTRTGQFCGDTVSSREAIRAEKKAAQLLDILRTGINSGFDPNIIFEIRGKKYNFPISNIYGLGMGDAEKDGYAADVFAVGYNYPSIDGECIIVRRDKEGDKFRFNICRQFNLRIAKYIKILQQVVIEVTQSAKYEESAVFKEYAMSPRLTTVADICGEKKILRKKK